MKISMKHIIVVLIAVVFCSPLLRSDDKYKDCKEAMDKKDYTSAIECLRDALRKEKTDPTGFIWLGQALMAIDSADAATGPLIRARDIDNVNVEALGLLGDAYMKQKIAGAAIDYYKRASEIDSLGAGIFLKLAEAYMATRLYTDAALAYRKALARDTSNIEVYKKLGTLYYTAKQYVNVAPFLGKYVARDTNATKEKLMLVNSLYQSNKLEELIPYALSLLQSDTNNKDLVRMLSLAYSRNRNCAEAEKMFLKLEQIDSLKASDYLDLARCQKEMKKNDEAKVSFEKAFAKDSTMSAIFYDLGSLYMNEKRYQEAAAMFERKIATDTSANFRFASHLNAGLCLMQTKEYKSALAHIQASVDLRPDYITGWSSLAACYAQMDSTTQQRATYRKMIEIITAGGDENIERYKKQLEEAYRIDGLLLLSDQKYAPALEDFKKAVALDAKNCDTYFGMAQAYYFLKNNDDAKKYICKTLSLCPTKADAKKFGASIGVNAGDCGK